MNEKTGCGMRGVTIVELLIGFAIFSGVMTIVVVSLVQTFSSFRHGERFADKQQKQRVCFVRMGRTIQSLVKISSPGKAPSFRGDQYGFYIIFAQDDNLAEEKYYCDAQGALLRYSQTPADYKEDTFDAQDTCLAGLTSCGFSYSDGTTWKQDWAREDGVPKAVKVRYTFKDDPELHEFLANVPLTE